MRAVSAADISALVERLILDAAFSLSTSELTALAQALGKETSSRARRVLEDLLENAALAESRRLPLCQDCGVTLVWIERGDQVVIEGGSLDEAVNEGVRTGYEKGCLRRSVLKGALHRTNTGDNTPAFIRCECVPGDSFRLKVALKGGGSENTSALRMLVPADGRAGVVEFVVNTVREAGGRPCPPLILGVGVGGNFEGAALLAKKALLRPMGGASPVPDIAGLEQDILREVNSLGIGPMGLGGATTALAVHVEEGPCHIASFPVALNIECHSHRQREGEL